MRVLFDIGHPAHVHLFKNLIMELNSRGHQSWIAARDKEIVIQILKGYGYKHEILSRQRSGYAGLFAEYITHSLGFYKMARKYKPDLLVGCTPSVSLVSKLYSAKSIIFSEDDPEVVKLAALLTYPLADTIFMPDCIKSFWPKRISYAGYHELAYLHPNDFIPNPDVFSKLGMEPGEPYYIIRLVSMEASHDRGESGLSLSMIRRLIHTLSKNGQVFISSEKPVSPEFEIYRFPLSPEDIHDALYYAKMLISDSQTMTIEAAVLGTPAVRCNTFVGRISCLQELENRYQLTFGFQPEAEERMFSFIINLLGKPDLATIWQQRRQKMLSEKIDVTVWMVDIVERVAQGAE